MSDFIIGEFHGNRKIIRPNVRRFHGKLAGILLKVETLYSGRA